MRGVGRNTISSWVKQLSPIKISGEETATLKELKTLQYELFGLELKKIFDESKQRYGAVKICRSLNDNGIVCSQKRVQRHMKAGALRSVVVKKYNHSANKGTIPDNKENILQRNFEAETIHQRWCTDNHLYPCVKRRLDVSCLRHGFMPPQDCGLCIRHIYDSRVRTYLSTAKIRQGLVI